MATQVFLHSGAATTHRGTNSATLADGAQPWLPLTTGTTRGAGLATRSRSTVTGATDGIELTTDGGSGTARMEWLTPPVDADVTISGTITANVWASENNMSANVAINVVIDKVAATDGTITQIVKSTRTTEVAVTTRAVNNFTTGMTAADYSDVSVNKGDRLRIRVFGDDAGTMAAGFTFNVGYAGTTAAADGDTFITFTETFGFQTTDPTGPQEQTNSNLPKTLGADSLNQKLAQSFQVGLTGPLGVVEILAGANTGTPTDNITAEIHADSSGAPSGTPLDSSTITSGSWTASGWNTFTGLAGLSLTASTTYWLVLYRTGSLDSGNVRTWGMQTSASYASGKAVEYNGSTWGDLGGGNADFAFRIYSSNVLHLTDTASAVATSSVDREAWTSRGGGVSNDVTNTANGYTSPIQVTDTAGGTVVDWFTKQLQAFTLGGMAQANIRAAESNAAANASIGIQIARVDPDGTNATVWGYANRDAATTSGGAGEIATTEAAYTITVSGDDLAITDGQRLRIRLLMDDCADTALVTGHTVTTYYGGTSGGASGDTWITFPQTLTEFTGGGDAQVTPATIARSFTVDAVDERAGVSLTPTTVARSFVVDQAAAGAAITVNPDVIARSFAIDAVDERAGVSITPTTVARSFAIDAVDERAGVSITPATVARSFVIDQASGQAHFSITPATIARSFVIDAVDERAASSVTPATIARAFAVDQVSAGGTTQVDPAVIARAFTLPAAEGRAASSVTPVTVARAFVIDAVDERAGVSITPATVARAFVMDAAQGRAASSVTPATVARAFVMDAVSVSAFVSITPATVARAFVIQQATPQTAGNATVSPALIARAFVLDAAEARAGAATTPAAMARAFALNAVTINAASSVTPATVARLFVIPQVTVTAGGSAQVNPDVIARLFVIAELVDRSCVSITPATVARAFVIPQATATGGTDAAPAPAVIARAFVIPLASIGLTAAPIPATVALVVEIPAAEALGRPPEVLTIHGPKSPGAPSGAVFVGTVVGDLATGPAFGSVAVLTRTGPLVIAAPQVEARNGSANSNLVTSSAFVLPDGLGAGDYLLVIVSYAVTGNVGTFSDGIAKLPEVENTTGDNNGLLVGWKRVTGSEGWPGTGAQGTVTWNVATRMVQRSYRISGAADAAPDLAALAVSNITTVDPPSLNPAGGSKFYRWVTGYAASGLAMGTTPPAGYADLVTASNASSQSSRSSITTADRELNAGSDDPGTFDGGSGVEEAVAFTLAVTPA